jgi:hypothetical protein
MELTFQFQLGIPPSFHPFHQAEDVCIPRFISFSQAAILTSRKQTNQVSLPGTCRFDAEKLIVEQL